MTVRVVWARSDYSPWQPAASLARPDEAITAMSNRGVEAMFEVIITLRADFSEHVVDRFATQQEAQEEAGRIAQGVVRAWVRRAKKPGRPPYESKSRSRAMPRYV